MKFIIKFLFLAVLYSCDNSGTQLDYYPEQRECVTDEKYKKAINTLSNTYEHIKNNNNEFINIDHINLTTSFIWLKEPKEKVLLQLNLAIESDLESTAEIFMIVYS
jgi:hypothetical protein